MFRLAVAVSLLISAVCAVGQSPQTSDPFAVSLSQQSVTALTGGINVADLTLNATVISILGSDYETGTATLQAKGTSESRVDFILSGGTRSDVRNITNGVPAGAWGKNSRPPSAYAQHNCWTDAAWFFPALSSLTQTANQNFIFKYVAQEQYNGAAAQHIRVYQVSTQNPYLSRLSAVDFYLDATSHFPLGAKFNVHADQDMNTEIPAEVRFANYQQASGVLVPFHVQRLLNGNLVLDIMVTSAVFNSGLSDLIFTLH